MRKKIIVLTKDERLVAIGEEPMVYQKPLCYTRKNYKVGDFFVLKGITLMNTFNEVEKQNILVKVIKLINNLILVEIPNTDKI